MTINECERFQSGTFGTWNRDIFDAVIQHFGIDRKSRVKQLSRGERAGVGLALTLAPEPELLILDDPALGLDPVARRALLEAMLYVTRDEQRTILFSSHLIGDVERVAHHVAILDRGVLRVQCPADEFRRRIGCWVLRFEESTPELPDIPGLLGVTRFPHEMRVTVAGELDQADGVLRSLLNVQVDRQEVAMEDAVVNYMDDRGRRRTLLQSIDAET